MQRLALLAASALLLASRLPAEYGPPRGRRMPNFALQDQSGKVRSLRSLLGPKGAVILFFRSADW